MKTLWKIPLVAILIQSSFAFAKDDLLPLFGSLSAKCPDLFAAQNGTPEERIAEFYTRLLDEYRKSISDDEYRRYLRKILASRDVYALPTSGSGQMQTLITRLKEIDRTGKLPTGESVSTEKVRNGILDHLQEEMKRIQVAVRTVEKAVDSSRVVKNPMEKWSWLDAKVNKAFLSRDGSSALVTTNQDLLFLNLKEKKVAHTLPGFHIEGPEFADRDFRRVVARSWNNHEIALWEPTTGNLLLEIPSDSFDEKLISSDFKSMIILSHQDRPLFVDLEKGKILQTEKRKVVDSPIPNTDFTRALLRFEDGLGIWNLRTGVVKNLVGGSPTNLRRLAVSPDFKYAISMEVRKGKFYPTLWDLKLGRLAYAFEPADLGDVAATELRFSSDGERILCEADDHGMSPVYAIWDVKRGTVFPRKNHPKGAIRISPDLRRGFTWASLSLPAVLDLERDEVIHELPLHKGRYSTWEINADRTRALIKVEDGPWEMWDLNTGAKLRSYDHWEVGGAKRKFDIEPVQFDPGWTRALGWFDSTSGKKWVVLDFEKGTAVILEPGPDPALADIHVSIDENWRRILSINLDGTVDDFDVEKAKALQAGQ